MYTYNTMDLEFNIDRIGDNEYLTFTKYNCEITARFDKNINDTLLIESFMCTSVGSGNGKRLLKEALEHLEAINKLPSNISITACSDVINKFPAQRTDAENYANIIKLVDYYQRLGFIPIGRIVKKVWNTNNIYSRQMSGKTMNIMTKLAALLHNGGRKTRRRKPKSKRKKHKPKRKTRKSKR